MNYSDAGSDGSNFDPETFDLDTLIDSRPPLFPSSTAVFLASQARTPYTKPQEADAPRTADYSAMLRGLSNMRRPDLSAVLPACPVCDAPALAYYDTRYTTATSIGHNCNCAMDREYAYTAGLILAWSRRHALPNYRAMLPLRLRDATVTSLDRDADNAPVLDMADSGRSVFVYGPPGRGKSAALAAAGRFDAESGKSVAYYSAPELIASYRAAERGEGSAPRMEHFDTVFLDDLDKVRPTPLAWEALYRVTEHVYANRKRLLVSAQLKPSETAQQIAPDGTAMETVGALVSRLGSGAVLRLGGRDRRYGSE